MSQKTLSVHSQMLKNLIEATLTLTRLLEREITNANEPDPAHKPAPPAGVPEVPDDADPPIQSTDANTPVDDTEVREPDTISVSFDPVLPGKLGSTIVEIATKELARPVKEIYIGDKPTNVDVGGHIKKYFVEGPRWKAETWESRKAKNGQGDSWCAAFASFCWRSAHHQVGVELPVSLNAQCSELFAEAKKSGRFIPKDGEPAPGDIVFLGSDGKPGHVGVVEKKSDDGIISIIEGNAGANTDELCRSRLIPGKPRYAKLIGFLAAEKR